MTDKSKRDVMIYKDRGSMYRRFVKNKSIRCMKRSLNIKFARIIAACYAHVNTNDERLFGILADHLPEVKP